MAHCAETGWYLTLWGHAPARRTILWCLWPTRSIGFTEAIKFGIRRRKEKEELFRCICVRSYNYSQFHRNVLFCNFLKMHSFIFLLSLTTCMAGFWCWCHRARPHPGSIKKTPPRNGKIEWRLGGKRKYVWGRRGDNSLVELKEGLLVMYGNSNHSAHCPSSCKHVGFLQKSNNLEESGRMTHSDGAAKKLLSCDNGDPRFRRTETDFSNMFARGRLTRSKNPRTHTHQTYISVCLANVLEK